MAPTVITADLEAALARLAPEAQALLTGPIRSALGADPRVPLDPQDEQVFGFVLRPSETLFTAWLVALGKFVVFERSTAGATLTVCVPIDRVSRIVEQTGTGTAPAADGGLVPVEVTELVVELDADRTTVAAEQRIVNGVPTVVTVHNRTVYRLAESDPARREELGTFARALRSALGY